MIRPVTLVTFLAFIGSGLYLYQVKHQAQLVDRQIRRIHEATEAARARADVLRAEYALLNDPDRLAELAAEYVSNLKPTQPGQWTSMAEIDRRLPPVGGKAAEPAPLEPDAKPSPVPMAARSEPPRSSVARAEPPRPALHFAQAAAAAPATENSAPARSVTVVAVKPMPRMAPPAHAPTIVVAQVLRSPPPTPLNLARAAPFVPPAATPAVLVGTAPPPRAVASFLPRVSPLGGGSLLGMAARPAPQPVAYVPPPATTAEAIARIARGEKVDPTVPVVASALGMARTMLSVTPVSPAVAGTLYPQSTPR